MKIGRIFRLGVAGVGSFGVFTLAVGSWGLWRTDRAVHREASAQVESGEVRWKPLLETWKVPSGLRELMVQQVDRDGTHVFWPEGLDENTRTCPVAWPQLYDSPVWERDGVTDAAECALLDTFREGASASRLELLDAALEDPDRPDAYFLGGYVSYWPVRTAVGAFLARARMRMHESSYDSAEDDLRAALSIGVLLLDGAFDLRGAEEGNWAVRTSLDHLRELNQIRGRSQEARRLEALLAALPQKESCRGPLKTGVTTSAISPTTISAAGDVVRDPEIPLAIRINALFSVVWGFSSHPPEVFFGPAGARETVVESLVSEGPFAKVGSDMQAVAELSFMERAARIKDQSIAGL